jgi:hypothetical protein
MFRKAEKIFGWILFWLGIWQAFGMTMWGEWRIGEVIFAIVITLVLCIVGWGLAHDKKDPKTGSGGKED